MRIIIPEADTTNHGDLSWSEIEALGDLSVFGHTHQDELISRCNKAEILITNKLKVGQEELDQMPDLKLICQLATGYDNIDVREASKRGILVCNAVGYSTEAVAQHVFALLLSCTNHVSLHNQSVQEGEWYRQSWSYTLAPLMELNKKTLGIYGFGKIGQAVARIGQAFGMTIIVNTRTPQPEVFPDVAFLELEEVFQQADVISLHAPLSDANIEIINSKMLQLAKTEAILINTGRGGLIHESDLRAHLEQNVGFTAALDVLSKEPPELDHPLIGIKNCILTPHNAWVAKEARQRLVSIVADNIRGFLKGEPRNVLNP